MSASDIARPAHAIAIAGASGRMGRMLIEAIHQADDTRLAGALDIPATIGRAHV